MLTMKLSQLSDSMIWRNRIVFLLSLLGLFMAIYVLQSFIRESSIICLTGGGCEAVRKHPASYIYGVPVPAVGLVGYAFLTVLSFLRSMSNNRRILHAMVGIALFGIVFVSWFTYTELYVIRGVCFWCTISAANMFIIFGILSSVMVSARKEISV
jgi:uncharacterized membrane protein